MVARGILMEAYNLAGGLIAWAEAGLPLETGASFIPRIRPDARDDWWY